MKENTARSSISFGSTKEALAHLESLTPNESVRPLLFRGEGNRYPTSQPSLYRLPEDERMAVGVFVTMLAKHFWSDVLWPSVEFRAEGLYFGGELLGDLYAIEHVRSAPSYLNAQHQFEPLFQHYGWPTTWLDVTYDPRVAVFFASFDFGRKRFTTNGIGHVYYWDQSDLREQDSFIDIVDLRYLARLLSHALDVESTRPSRQSAVSIRVGRPVGIGLYDHDRVVASARHCVTFDRHDVQDVASGHDYYFPRDDLKELLDAFQRKYLRWAERYNQDNCADHRIRAVDVWQRLERRAADEQRLHWESRGINYADVERYYDCAFGLAYHRQIISAASKYLAQASEFPAQGVDVKNLKYEQFDEYLRALTGERRFNT